MKKSDYMIKAKSKMLCELRGVDDFLSYTLHYDLPTGIGNDSDGHAWRFEKGCEAKIKAIITKNFKDALDEFFKSAKKVEEE